MSETIREIEHCWIAMADGVRLSARLWLPATLPAPAVVEYIPYRKRDMVRARDERNHPWFAAHGYACIRVDMRGSGDSEGLMTDMYSRDELGDALAVLEWIKNQDWCDGAIGMMGTSWGGTSALQAAASGSGLLKAVIAVCATDNRYADDIHHMGGCLLTDSIEWGATLPAILALPPAAESDPQGWRQNWLDRLEQLEFPLFEWIEHETRDAYWRHGSVSENPGSFDCPVLAVGGWSDRYSNTVMNLLADNPKRCWGIVGPWGHHYPDQGVPGPAIGFQQEALRWWDCWLRGQDNGANRDPRLRVWCNEFQAPADFLAWRKGHWRVLEDWAGAQARQDIREFSLAPRRGPGDDQPGFVNLPFDLRIGAAAGDTGYFGRPGGLPTEQSPDDAHSLVLQTEILEKQQVLLGKAAIKLALKVERQPAQIVIRLCDVAPDGQVARVAYRIHNLALDEDCQAVETAAVSDPVRREFSLPNAAYLFAAGHRIRIALSASYWPQIWPTPGGTRAAVDCASAKLRLALAPDEARPAEHSIFSEPLSQVDRDPAAIDERIQRNIEIDAGGRQLVYRWHQPLAPTRHDKVNIEIGAETTAEHRIDLANPLSADCRFEHVLQAVHGARRFETRGVARVFADEKNYRVEGSLRVVEEGNEVFSRDWSRGIRRKHA